MLIELKHKTAIITGAASGVGLATAIEFLNSGIELLVAVDIAPEPPGELQAFLQRHAETIVYMQGECVTKRPRFGTLNWLSSGRDALISW